MYLDPSLSEITLLFDLSLYLDQTLAQRKAKSKVKVAQCAVSFLLRDATQSEVMLRQSHPFSMVCL